jgi:(1->4)-alpha-D-glucan 1-alpha-D-glucosylmutase
LLKLTVPGVPDVYQGDELELLALVDPDNRRPVDWQARRTALDIVRGAAAPTHETAKLHLIVRALELRARRPDAFARGAYTPVAAGPGVCAFTRGEDEVLAVAPMRDWRGAPLHAPPGRWVDVLTGAEHALAGATPVDRLLGPLGVALLERAG